MGAGNRYKSPDVGFVDDFGVEYVGYAQSRPEIFDAGGAQKVSGTIVHPGKAVRLGQDVVGTHRAVTVGRGGAVGADRDKGRRGRGCGVARIYLVYPQGPVRKQCRRGGEGSREGTRAEYPDKKDTQYYVCEARLPRGEGAALLNSHQVVLIAYAHAQTCCITP